MDKWISAEVLPKKTGESHTYLITDGETISTGWYEKEYFARGKKDKYAVTYSSAMWHDDGGFEAEPTHWMKPPRLPRKEKKNVD